MSNSLDRDMAVFLGLARRDQLLALGHAPRSISAAVRAGTVFVPRRGWIATAAAPPTALRAVALGGRLGGSSALVSYGVWVDDDTTLVVACAPTSSRLPELGPNERRIWSRAGIAANRRTRWRASVEDALLQLAMTASREELISSIDSALQRKLLDARALEALFAALPRRFGNLRKDVDGAAMSGTESRFRLALRAAGHRVATQVAIPGAGDVDLLVEGWLIVELDSKKHHGTPEQQALDRLRDGNAVLAGYGHERFMWSQVRYNLSWCLAVVEQRLRDGRPDRAPLDRSHHLQRARSS